MLFEQQRGQFLISTDKRRLDLDVIHGFLTTAYWSPGIPRAVVERAIEHSLAFGVYELNAGAGIEQQVGLARLVTDYTTFAYLADVFILVPYRGRGLSKWLLEAIVAYPELQGLRRWLLATKDAHGLYQKAGFSPLQAPERFMERHIPNIYLS